MDKDNSYAISDSGFSGLKRVCPGFKSTYVDTKRRKKWDEITRSEQKRVEHINNWLKTLTNTFKGSQLHLKCIATSKN